MTLMQENKTRLSIIQEKLSTSFHEMGRQVADYVPRVVVQEEIEQQEALELIKYRQFLQDEKMSKLLDDNQLTTQKYVVLIGGAGSGKSFILQRRYLTACQSFLNDPTEPIPCYLDLEKDLSHQESVETAIVKTLSRRYHFSELLGHNAGFILFFDELDRRLVNEANPYDFVNGLLEFIEENRQLLSCVVIACRRVRWKADWFNRSSLPWQTYHADTLTYNDYQALIPKKEQLKIFLQAVAAKGIQELLKLPFFGFDLAKKFIRDENLPENRLSWFKSKVEESLTYKKHELQSPPPLSRLLLLAQQLACLSSFSKLPDWTKADVIDSISASDVLRHELGAPVDSEIQFLLQCPLFTKRNERYSFSHQLFQEYLAAQTLETLPLRKQRQLLETAFPSLGHRILTSHRGIAVFLAEMSASFFEHLLEADPLVAFMAEGANLPNEKDTLLTQKVIDNAILHGRAPWFEVPPQGEKLYKALPRHRPDNISEFIHPYIARSDEFSLLWATTCASMWNGSSTLNARLNEIVHDDKVHLQARLEAINAILATEIVEDISRLYDVLDSPDTDDQVRGHVLRAYRKTSSPLPADYISKLRFRRNQRNLLSLLQLEPAMYAKSLRAQELEAAFLHLDHQFDEIEDLRPHFCQGLLERAVEIGWTDIPPTILLHISVRERHYCEVQVKNLLSLWQVFVNVWDFILFWLGNGNPAHAQWAGLLADAVTDQIFDLLPTNTGTLNEAQTHFIENVLKLYYLKEPSIERFYRFKHQAPQFARRWKIPKHLLLSPGRDAYANRVAVLAILNRDVIDDSGKAFGIVRTVAELENGPDSYNYRGVKSTDVAHFINELSAPLRHRVIKIFKHQVSSLRCSDFRARPGVVNPNLAIPFWVLVRLQEEFDPTKLEEFIRCFAYSYPSEEFGSETFDKLLDILYQLDPVRWIETVHWLVESPGGNDYETLRYLTSQNSDAYLARCKERLSQHDFTNHNVNPLIKYLLAMQPEDLVEILHSCYPELEEPGHKASVLYILLSFNDDWAWEELQVQIMRKNPAFLMENEYALHLLLHPPGPERLTLLTNWYAWTRRHYEEFSDPISPHRFLEDLVVQIGGERAISELRRLQAENAFPNAQWLSYLIIKIEDRMLDTFTRFDSVNLLDFVNREAFGFVVSQRDLFEWVCQSIEDVKERIEKRGEQVLGYWNRRVRKQEGDEWWPKHEVECQNVLWPSLRDRLFNIGIVGIEERFIQFDRADFLVEKPQIDAPLRVVVELKTARENYGFSRLIDVVEQQLWLRYMEPMNLSYGIYIALWFKDERYLHPKRWATAEKFREELELHVRGVEMRHNIIIAPYVIDMTTSVRIY